MPLRIPFIGGGARLSLASLANSPRRRMSFYRHSSLERFENPLPGAARVAILFPHFLQKDGVRCFEEDDAAGIAKFAPEILAGTVPALIGLAATIRPAKAIIALSGSRAGTAGSWNRNLLWSAFQVPLFEQCFGPDGRVFARECEAHDGLHLFGDPHYQFALRAGTCPCGRSEPRL